MNEDDLLITCALRFDGYRYAQEHGFDPTAALETLKTQAVDRLSVPEQMTLFFHLQRFLFKWGADRRPRTSASWRIFHQLFLAVAGQEVPQPYRIQPYFDRWQATYAHQLEQHLRQIQDLLRTTRYDPPAVG